MFWSKMNIKEINFPLSDDFLKSYTFSKTLKMGSFLLQNLIKSIIGQKYTLYTLRLTVIFSETFFLV